MSAPLWQIWDVAGIDEPPTEDLFERLLEEGRGKPATGPIDQYVQSLASRWPDREGLDEDAEFDCPWACQHVTDMVVADRCVQLDILNGSEVLEDFAQMITMAVEQGLVCWDLDNSEIITADNYMR